MRLLHNVPFAQVRVDDGPPEWFVIDTGAPVSVFAARIERRLKRRRVAPEEGDAPSELFTFDDVRLGDAPIPGVEGMISDLDVLQDHIGIPLGGLLGFPAFEGVLLTLDYTTRQIVIERGALPDVDQRDVLGVTLHELHPAITVRFAGADRTTELDSGSGFYLQTTAELFDALPMASPPRITSRLQTFTRESVARSGRARGPLAVGAYVVHDPIVVDEQPADTSLESNDVVRLGGPFLKSFRVTFDQRNHRVRLARATHDPIEVPPVRTLGMSFVRGAEGWHVVGFIPDVPEHGVLLGDRVVSVDGVPETAIDSNVFEVEGVVASRRFVFARGTKQFDVTVPVTVLVP